MAQLLDDSLLYTAMYPSLVIYIQYSHLRTYSMLSPFWCDGKMVNTIWIQVIPWQSHEGPKGAAVSGELQKAKDALRKFGVDSCRLWRKITVVDNMLMVELANSIISRP